MRIRFSLTAAVVLALPTANLASAQAYVSTQSVRSADSTRSRPRIGDTVTLAGRVTLGLGVLETTQLNVYVQDSSGGTFVDADRPSPFLRLREGDSVLVTGTIDQDRSGNFLEDATVVLVPSQRREPAAVRVGALVPSRLASLVSRVVTVEATVVARSVGGGDDVLTIGHSDAEGNYVTVVEAEGGETNLALHAFSPGDRVRVTGVLIRRTSNRTGVTRYAIFPRSAADVRPLGMTARTRERMLGFFLAGLALSAIVAWRWRAVLRRRRELARAEEALRESTAQYRVLVEQAPIGIVVHRDAKILFANSAFACLAAAEGGVQALTGRGLADFISADKLARISEGSRRGMEPNGPERVLAQLKRLNGQWAHVEITDGPIVYEGEQCVQAVFYDVTERVRAELALAESEAQLLQAQKMEAVGQLAGGVAHDFNNILTAIKGNAEFLQEGCAKCGTVPPESEEIDRAADRAAGLTHQLLAFSRKQIIQPRVIEVDGLVRNLEPMLRRLVPENVLQRFTRAAGGQCVSADPGQLEQVILNLVVNARDAMPRGGVLEVSTGTSAIGANHRLVTTAALPPGGYVTISVRDTGMGMDAVTKQRAFEPFFTTKEQGKGTGLGLSTVYGIVKQSEGCVELDSAPGAGTTFTIYLPRVEAAARPITESPIEAASMRGVETILVVEDEPAIRRLAARTLEHCGYTVLLAEDGVDALSTVHGHTGRIDLLLTDVVMPGLGGPDVARQLGSARMAPRVLFMTGYMDDLMMSHGVLSPGVDLLEKPFTPKQLLERVRRALDAKAAA